MATKVIHTRERQTPGPPRLAVKDVLSMIQRWMTMKMRSDDAMEDHFGLGVYLTTLTLLFTPVLTGLRKCGTCGVDQTIRTTREWPSSPRPPLWLKHLKLWPSVVPLGPRHPASCRWGLVGHSPGTQPDYDRTESNLWTFDPHYWTLKHTHTERERERQRDRETETDRQRERQRQTETDRQIDRHTERDRQTDRQIGPEKYRQTGQEREMRILYIYIPLLGLASSNCCLTSRMCRLNWALTNPCEINCVVS